MLLLVQTKFRFGIIAFGALVLMVLSGAWLRSFPQAPVQTPPPAANPAASQQTPPTPPNFAAPGAAPPQKQAQRNGLSTVVIDPAHGGTDPGARGAGGMRESDLVLDYAGQLRRALEAQGFQVRLTRQGNDNPSFDDRSAMANAQRGTAFVTLHVASTGSPGTVRVYTMTPFPPASDPVGLIPWDRAQSPFLALSQKLADLAQGQLTLQFKGSPNSALPATVRQLRTTAAPAIAVEVSSILIEDPGELARVSPGLADAIARAIVAFRPFYDASPVPGTMP